LFSIITKKDCLNIAVNIYQYDLFHHHLKIIPQKFQKSLKFWTA